MVHDFEKWMILESRGFPESLIGISNFLFNFISSKVDWWVSRKGPANYSEEFVFWEDDFDFKKNPDFPIKRFKLDLEILVVNENPQRLVSGVSVFFKDDIPFNPNLIGGTSLIERGEVIPNLYISIKMDRGNYMNDIKRMKNNLKAIIRHELIHFYQSFKIKKAGNRNISPWRNTPISKGIREINDYGSDTFDDLLHISYFLMTREEFDASLSEITAGESGRIKKNRRVIKSLSKISPEVLIKRIRNEVNCSELDLENIPINFLKNYEKNCKKHKINPIKWVLKLRNKGFDDFVSSLLDIVKFRGEKWMKKANIIKYKNN